MISRIKLAVEVVAGAVGFLLLIAICGTVLYALEEITKSWV